MRIDMPSYNNSRRVGPRSLLLFCIGSLTCLFSLVLLAASIFTVASDVLREMGAPSFIFEITWPIALLFFLGSIFIIRKSDIGAVSLGAEPPVIHLDRKDKN